MTDLPVLPYAGTSGHSGSDTSRERAETDDRSGRTKERQKKTLDYAHIFGAQGLTVLDLRDLTGWHHGVASGVLSVLHKEGQLACLTERRDKCCIYVKPEWTNDRETRAHGRNKPKVEEKTYSVAQIIMRQWPEGIRFRVVE